MKCSQVQSVLSEYLDGELSIVQAAGVREHLDCCVCCEARWRMLRQTVRLVAHMGQEKCPVDLRAPVAMAVQHRYAGRRARFPFIPFAVISGAGTALAALVVGLSMLRPDIAVGGLEAAIPAEQPAVVAEAPVHDRFELATGLGSTADGILLAIRSDEQSQELVNAREEQKPRTSATN